MSNFFPVIIQAKKKRKNSENYFYYNSIKTIRLVTYYTMLKMHE